jgi:hypothetical protein
MPNSTIQLEHIVKKVRAYPEISSVLPVDGYSDEPAITIATDAMRAMLAGYRFEDGRKAGPFPFKWNRLPAKRFTTISWQQDYAQLNLTNCAWLEHAYIQDVNNTANPQQIFTLETGRDIEKTSNQYGRPGQICWLPNDQLTYGTWGGPVYTQNGPTNPGPGTVYTQPLGQVQTPTNPTTQIQDANGNLLVLTTFGTTGSTPPAAAAGATPGTTVEDGSCVWTVADPKGQGFRVAPIPPQNGVVWGVQVIMQMRALHFKDLQQTLEPIPDDFASFFRQGFVAYSYLHSPEPKVFAKFETHMRLWMQALQDNCVIADREKELNGWYPDRGVMDAGGQVVDIGPANPYAYPGPWS